MPDPNEDRRTDANGRWKPSPLTGSEADLALRPEDDVRVVADDDIVDLVTG